jgi:DNA-binding transcriptional LysR family regulator
MEQLAQFDLLTFQRGSQPHVALMDILRQTGVVPKRVHAISSISAMTQLVVNGFGIATLPRIAVQRLLQYSELSMLRCDQALQPLPVFASYRADPLSMAAETVFNSVFAFLDNEARAKARKVANKG